MDEELINLLHSYTMPPDAAELLKRAHIIFMVGVSGAGKNTIIKQLLKSDKYKLVISHTTRKPRKNNGILEQNGREYHFIDQNQARQMLESGEFIEAKIYSGNIYGTSVKEIKSAYDKNKIAISDIEVQGVSEYMRVAPNVKPVFILPPDFDTWRRRLRARYESVNYEWSEMEKRLETAKKELAEALSKDYFEFVVNDDLARSVQSVDEIAHGHISARKNQEARQIAQALLTRLG